jgi:hypothetical protein
MRAQILAAPWLGSIEAGEIWKVQHRAHIKTEGTTKYTNHTKNEVPFVYFVYFVV